MRLILILGITFLFCSKPALQPLGTPELEFERGVAYYNKGSYKEAMKSFEYLIFNFPGSGLIDDAQIYIARAQLKMKHYDQANLEAQFLIDNFPRSEHVEEAYLIKARALYATLPSSKRDQTQTEEAINTLEQFIEIYPNSKFLPEIRKILFHCRSRIAEKELKNGLFYKRRGDLGAALIYFRMIIARYPETPVAREARYNLARILEKRLRIDDARKHYQQLTDSLDVWGKKAKERLAEIEK